MKVVCLRGAFGFENLSYEDQPEPACGPDQVLIRVRAVSLNYRDVMMVRGEYNPKQKLPLIPCSDAAGEIVALGSQVTGFSIGERVCPTVAPLWQSGIATRSMLRSALGGPESGTLTEYFAANASAVVRPPPQLTDSEAACLPCAGLTAFRALVTLGGIASGQTVVCQGTGGVSLFALGFAKAVGARVVLTSRSADKLERARALAPDLSIDTTRTPDWAREVRAFTNGEGVDHVIEVVGGATLAESVRATRPGGSVSVIGVLSGAEAKLDLRPILMQNIRIQGVFIGDRRSFEAMATFIGEHELRPNIESVFPLRDARAAFELVASGKQFGKVCVAL